jgi:gliding motility-associated-like protein
VCFFATGQCKDSSFVKSYSTTNSTLIIREYINTQDNGALLFIGDFQVSEMQGVLKLAANGDIQWNRIFFPSSTNEKLILGTLLQLKDGSYIIGCNVSYKTGAQPAFFVLIKLDGNGNMIWQHKYKNSYGSSFADDVQVTGITEGKSGELIAQIEENNILNITKFAANGTVVWSNQYWSGGVVFAKPTFQPYNGDNTLDYWGITYLQFDCFNNLQKQALTNFRINYSTGDMDTTKIFCIAPGKASVGVLHVGFNRIISKRIDNGSTVLFIDNPESRTLLINKFDRNNNFISSKLFTPPDTSTFAPRLYYKFDVNAKTGNIVFSFNLQRTTPPYNGFPYIFQSYLDSNFNLRQQLYVDSTPLNQFGANPKFAPNNSVNYIIATSSTTSNVSSQFSFANTPVGFAANGFCNTKDSLYGSFSDHGLVLSDNSFTWDSIRHNVYVLDGDATLAVSSLAIQQTNTCKKISICDTLKIHGNTLQCLSSDTFTYTAYKNPHCFKKIYWQADTSNALMLRQANDTTIQLKFKRSGIFKLYARLENCSVQDSMQITVAMPQQHFSINKDNQLCPGKNILLQASTGFKTYQWQDGTKANNYLVTKPGMYKVTATDSCGNVFEDSVVISLVDTSVNLPVTQTICLTDSFSITLPPNAKNILWEPGENGLTQGNKLSLYPSKSTDYTISFTAGPDCIVKKRISLKVEMCPNTILFPNSFTPNNDNLNDIFKPWVNRPLQFYRLRIYNRYGQKIFESADPEHGWNGTFRTVPQTSGTYIWECMYKFRNAESNSRKGSCILLR